VLLSAPDQHRLVTTDIKGNDCIFYAVCLVDNGAFSAAAVAHSQRELEVFNLPSDKRSKVWFYIPKEALLPFCPILE